MPISTPWVFLESECLHRINDLGAGGSPSEHDTSYRAVPKVVNTNITDAGFAPGAIREAIVETCLEVIAFICRTDGDPRRESYKLTSTVAHGGTLPPSMGPYGTIYDASSGNRPLERRSATEIAEIRSNPNGVYTGISFYYYALDGQALYHTLTGNATVERFDYARTALTYNAMDTLFSSLANIAPIPDEFAVVVADGAAGRLAGKGASMISEAANFMQLYYQGLKDRGLNAQAAIDYAPKNP